MLASGHMGIMLPISSNGETADQSQAATGRPATGRPWRLFPTSATLPGGLRPPMTQGMFFTFACAYLPKWTPVPEIWAVELAVLARRCYNAGR